MSWRGGRVTEPKPVVRAPLDDYRTPATAGLDPVFKGLDTAKSHLRHIEYRLNEAEQSNAHPDNLSIPVDRVPSYTLPSAKTSSVVVDSMGKTQYLRSREERSRKISRLEEKYKERSEESARSKHHEVSDRKLGWMGETVGTASAATSGYKSATGSTLRGLSTLDGQTLDPQSNSAPRHTHRTDPGAYQDASVHFLNDDVLTRNGGVHGYMDLPSRWTKVNVNIPSATSGLTTKGLRSDKTDPLASTYPPKAISNDPRLTDTNFTYKDSTQTLASSGSSAASAPPNVNATYTVNGASSNDSLHFKPKKSLKDLERSSDTLEKLREKVRQQKMASSGESQGSSDDIHLEHKSEDPVITRSLAPPTQPTLVRKVAAGPPVPRYQGFSEVEMKYSLPDGKMVKVSDIRRRKMKRQRKEAPLKEKNAQNSGEREPQEKRPPKPSRIIAASKKPSKMDRESDVITARSWRVGAELVLRELGPNRAPKLDDPSTSVKEKSRTALEDDEQHPSESAPIPPRAVLKRPKPPVPQDDESDESKKQRHYNIDEVKQYIIKQKMERRKQQMQEAERQKMSREQRQAQLSELFRRQREVAGKPIILPTDGSKIAINRTLTLDGPSTELHDDAQKGSGESDKENGGVNSVGAWGDVSSADSTLSGGSGESGPGLPPRRDPSSQNVRGPKDGGPVKSDYDSIHPGGASGSLPSKYNPDTFKSAAGAGRRTADSGFGTSGPDISKYLKDSGIDVNQIVTQYAKRAADIGINYNQTSSSYSRMGAGSSLPSRFKDDRLTTVPKEPLSSTATMGDKRSDRIRALCDNASRLGNRLETERRRISTLAQTAISDKWAYRREDVEEPEFRSRYDKMAGLDGDKIYDSGIPGIGSMYKSRKTGIMDEKRPRLSSTSSVDYANLKDSDVSELSDSTLQEDDLYHSLAIKKPTAKIRLPTTSVKPALGDFGRLRASTPARWEEPRGDPYSVINVLSRRKDQLSYNPYKRVGIFNDEDSIQSEADLTLKSDISDQLSLSIDSTLTGEEPSVPSKYSKRSHLSVQGASHLSVQGASHQSVSPVSVSQLSGSEADSSLADHLRSYDAGPAPVGSLSHRSVSHHSSRNGVTDGGLSHRSTNHSHRSNTSQHSRPTSKKSLSHRSATKKRDGEDVNSGLSSVHNKEDRMEEEGEEESEDDTLEEQPYSSMASDLDDKLEGQTPRDVEVSDISESSETSLAEMAGNRRGYAPGGISYRSSAVSGRLSPGGLERRMTAELNLLESMEESVRQLADVDRARGVSLAQQETVSLAQVLKAQEQNHNQQVSAFQRDSNLMSREVLRAQKITADAAESSAQAIDKARHDTTRSLQDSTINLIAAQSEATKATAEAARQLAEVKMAASGASAAMNTDNASRLIQDTAVATATAVAKALADTKGLKRQSNFDDHATQYSRRSATPAGASTSVTDSYDSDFTHDSASYHPKNKGQARSRSGSRASYTMDMDTASRGSGSVKTGSIATATDLSAHTLSSVATEAGLIADNSKSESIIEEVISEKIKDDSIDFDTSITEEEMEKSLREVIPSEDHRKKVKKTSSQSDISSIASDDHPPSGVLTPSRRLSFEGDSFTKFTMDMVRQYMREEEIRAQHQAALLKLRERALKEKTQAELAWLEQQKHKVRDKGADESFPLLKKKKRGVLMRLQAEQAEIRRLKEASKAASKERQFLLLQSQEIAKLRQSTQLIWGKYQPGHSKVEEWLNDVETSCLDVDTYSSLAQVKEKIKESGVEVEREDPVKLDLDASDAFSVSSPTKVDAESVFNSENGDKPQDLKPLQKLRKMKLDDKFLTHREQQLLQRRLNVEGLLAWKKKLDMEEAEIEAMEKHALAITRLKEKEAQEKASKDGKAKDTKTKESAAPRTPRADTIASELDSIKEESYSESFATISRSRPSKRTDVDISEDVPDTARTQPSQSSIQEDFPTYGQSAASIGEDISAAKSGKRTPDSSEETTTQTTTHEEYVNETFESDAGTVTQTNTTAAAPGSKKGSASTPRITFQAKPEAGVHTSLPKSPKSPLKSPTRRGSESDSEDSFSLVHSETASDQSDVEVRIRALNEDLKRRKSEAEKLKKEAKKKQKDRLRQEEHALKKKIEAYDKYIDHVRTEIKDQVPVEDSNAVQPQIKKPTSGQKKKSPPSIPRLQTDARARSDSGGSSIDNGLDSPGQTTPLSPITPGTGDIDDGKAQSFSESIAESLMTPQNSSISTKKTSTPEDKSALQSQLFEQSETIEEVPEEATSIMVVEKEEESEVKLKLDISKTEEAGSGPNQAPQDNDTLLPTTGRSMASITEDIPTKSKDLDKSDKHKSKSESRESKSVKSAEFDEESSHTESHKTDKSFTYSTTTTASRSETSYTEEFTEATTGKSSKHRKDVKDVSKSIPKQVSEDEAHSVVESINTEEEVSEQLEAESEVEEDRPVFDLDSVPVLDVDPLVHISVGNRVLVGGAQPGTLKFKGRVQFATGYFGGIELDKPEGTNNGFKDGVKYFQCKDNCGIFAPPDKLKLLPADWERETGEEEEEELKSGAESDLSEATLHDEEQDVGENIAELRQDVTRPRTELPTRSLKEGGEEIAEDVSVATTVDSELERVISSAAAAVESFGEDLDETGRASPVDVTISDSISLKEQQLPTASSPSNKEQQELEKVVDNVTDGILHMVVKDSLEAVGDAAHKNKRSTSTPDVADEADAPETVTERKESVGTVSNKNQAVEAATQKLLNESISQILDIYKKKKSSEEIDIPGKSKPVSKPSDDEAQKVVDDIFETQKKHTDILILDNDPFASSSSGMGQGDKDDLDQLYADMEDLTGGMDEWFDDDFGLGIKKKAPPPYPGTQDKKEKIDSNELKLDLQKVNQEPFFAVPHKVAEVKDLTASAVEIFWQMRRYGEPWDTVTSPPSSYFAPADRSQDIESSNRRAYKQLVFELTGEILMDIYRDEDTEEEEQYSWMPQKRTRQKYHRSREPPTMLEIVEPIVKEHVLALVGLESTTKYDPVRASKWSSRKKRDRVDDVLLQELMEEEPDWVDYNDDETTVKMQIADSIFDSLLIETAAVFTSIAQRRVV